MFMHKTALHSFLHLMDWETVQKREGTETPQQLKTTAQKTTGNPSPSLPLITPLPTLSGASKKLCNYIWISLNPAQEALKHPALYVLQQHPSFENEYAPSHQLPEQREYWIHPRRNLKSALFHSLFSSVLIYQLSPSSPSFQAISH